MTNEQKPNGVLVESIYGIHERRPLVRLVITQDGTEAEVQLSPAVAVEIGHNLILGAAHAEDDAALVRALTADVPPAEWQNPRESLGIKTAANILRLVRNARDQGPDTLAPSTPGGAV
mgnify:CR=1 FL=1